MFLFWIPLYRSLCPVPTRDWILCYKFAPNFPFISFSLIGSLSFLSFPLYSLSNQTQQKLKYNSHKSANERLALAIARCHDPHPVPWPLKIIDPTRQNPKLLLQHMIIMRPPNPDRPWHVSWCDPLSVGGETRHGSLIRVLSIDGDLERLVKVADDDRSTVGIENGVGFRIAGDENASAALRGRNAGVGFGELWHWGDGDWDCFQEMEIRVKKFREPFIPLSV